MQVDKIVRIASSVEGTWPNEIVLLNTEAKSTSLDILSIEERPDWQIPLVEALRSRKSPEGSQAISEVKMIKIFLLGGFLYKRSFTHP